MDTRTEQLSQLKSYTEEIDKDLTLILQSLQWDREHILQHPKMVSCKYDPNHKLLQDKKEEHEQECLLRHNGYTKDDSFLPDPPDTASRTLIKFSKADLKTIVRYATDSDPEFKRVSFDTLYGCMEPLYICPNTQVSLTQGVGCGDLEPLTLDRLQYTYSSDERRAIHDAVVSSAPSCHDLADIALPSTAGNDQAAKPKSRKEILAELRDMKRRRTKYRVAPKTRNYSDVLRDVISIQMDHFIEDRKPDVNQLNAMISQPTHPKQSVNPQPKQSVNPQPKQSVNPQPKQSVNTQPIQSVNTQPKQSVNPQPKQSVNPQPKQSVNPQPKQSVNPQPKQSVNPQPKQSVNPQLIQSVNPQPKQSVNTQPKQSVNPQPKQSVNPQPKQSVNPQPKQSVNTQPEQSVNPQQPADSRNTVKHTRDGTRHDVVKERDKEQRREKPNRDHSDKERRGDDGHHRDRSNSDRSRERRNNRDFRHTERRDDTRHRDKSKESKHHLSRDKDNRPKEVANTRIERPKDAQYRPENLVIKIKREIDPPIVLPINNSASIEINQEKRYRDYISRGCNYQGYNRGNMLNDKSMDKHGKTRSKDHNKHTREVNLVSDKDRSKDDYDRHRDTYGESYRQGNRESHREGHRGNNRDNYRERNYDDRAKKSRTSEKHRIYSQIYSELERTRIKKEIKKEMKHERY